MKIYHYHPDYKVYLGSSDADESPLEPGVFLIPAYATELEPPECDESEVPVFDGSSWSIIDNCSGVYYSTDTGNVIYHQDPLISPENATKEVPPEVPEGFYLTWDGSWELKEILPPPELTPEQKLAQSGLTVEELRTLLGLTP
jgi:hypothetical protein